MPLGKGFHHCLFRAEAPVEVALAQQYEPNRLLLHNSMMLLQNVCPKAKATIMGGGKGGFAEKFRGSGNLAVKIPDNMKPAHAAPLLCAGITVWSPIAKYVTKPGMKVRIASFLSFGMPCNLKCTLQLLQHAEVAAACQHASSLLVLASLCGPP